MKCYLDFMSDYEDKIMLLQAIGDELNTEHGVSRDIGYWYEGRITDKQLVEKLLPLCKLLNRLFYNHPPFET